MIDGDETLSNSDVGSCYSICTRSRAEKRDAKGKGEMLTYRVARVSLRLGGHDPPSNTPVVASVCPTLAPGST